MDNSNLYVEQPLMLSEKIYNRVAGVLDDLLRKTGAEMIIFCETNGYPVVYKGAIEGLDLQAISTLAANNFSATAKMADMLNEETGFKFLFHEGENFNIYISYVGYNFVLVVIFSVDVTLGMVRIFTKKALAELAKLLASAETEEEQSSSPIDIEFKSLLNEEVNRSLGELE
ncbi:roadblock/LC7 domain-containing protein [bacterium]|nr:roadblock/LC7 domain-containing protein [bacterium]